MRSRQTQRDGNSGGDSGPCELGGPWALPGIFREISPGHEPAIVWEAQPPGQQQYYNNTQQQQQQYLYEN